MWLQLVAHVEAVIDFGEDENIEDGILDEGGSVKPAQCFISVSLCSEIEGAGLAQGCDGASE